MRIQQHEKIIEEAYEIERDGNGVLWLVQTDSTGRVVYHKVRLFQEGWLCSVNDLIFALCELKKWVKNTEERKHLANRLILSCKSVSFDIYYLVKQALEDKSFF
jgi:hypothetical protein